MGNRIGKSLQFFIGRFEFRGPMEELMIEAANFILAVLALRDVIVGLQYACRPLLFVTAQRPSARNHHLASIGLRMSKFAFPPIRPKQLRADILEGIGKTVCNSSWERFPIACSAVHPYNSYAPRFQ